MELGFGTGILYGIPLTDAAGNAISNGTPVQFGQLQDIAIDLSFDEKMLYGASQFPIAVGRGKGKLEGKAKTANFNAAMIGSLFFGLTPSAGIRAVAMNQANSVPGSVAYTITPTPPSTGTWVTDLGVLYQNTGLPLTKVASAPALGQYSVSAGVYTFASADANAAVLISFEYTATSTAGPKSLQVTNQLMGYAPVFSAELNMSYLGKNLFFRFPNCIASKFTFPLKNDDFTIPEFDFSVFADATNTVCYVATAE